MDDYYGPKEKGARIVALTRSLYLVAFTPESSAGGGALLRLHPLLEGGFPVADRAAQLDVGRAIAGEPALGQPGHAQVQVPRRLFRGQQRIVLQGLGVVVILSSGLNWMDR